MQLSHFPSEMRKHASPLRRFFHALTASHAFSYPCENYPGYIHLLSSCKHLKTLLQIHALLIVSGNQKHQLTNTRLLKSYLYFKKYDFSRFLFDAMPNQSVRVFNSTIQAYVTAKNYQEAVKMYRCMLCKGIQPDKYTFTFVLKACTGGLQFKEGILIHSHIIYSGLDCDVYVGTALIDMYSKLGDVEIAREVFDRMPEKDVITWNAMISGLSQSGDPKEAFEFVRSMPLAGLKLDLVSIVNLVPTVSKLGDIGTCRCIHGYVIRNGFDSTVSNGLIDMYSKCGDIDVARRVFELMQGKNDISWTTMTAGYAHNKCFLEVLELFDWIKRENITLNKVSVTSALLAAAEMRDLVRGKEICDFAIEQGIESNIWIATAMTTMYAKCGNVNKAKQLFQGIKRKDVISWSAIIAALVQSGYAEDALSLFRDMQNNFLKANDVTLLSVLSACAELTSLQLGKSVHCYAVKASFDLDISTGTALVSMYAKCALFTSSLAVFDTMPRKDIVTCNALINEYAQIGDLPRTMMMYHRVQISEMRPDSQTMVALLSACVYLYDQEQGSCIHGQIIGSGFDSYCNVNNALIDMYAKCGNLSHAELLFKRTQIVKDEVSWNVLIAGYVDNGHAKDAISVFNQMKLQNFRPNLVTFVSVFPAVACQSAIEEGRTLHACVIRIGFQSNILVGNCLLDMYAKCGQLHISERLFREMTDKNTVSWNVMLAGYAGHGEGNRAIELFALMQKNHIQVDSLSFISLLSACRHAGLIDDGRKIFNSMYKEHHLEPGLEHYACMVDLLGRAGLFDEILHLIKAMPLEPDAGVWGALLGACKMHSNIQLAEFSLDHLVKLEPENPTHLVVLSNIYAKSGRWSDAGNTRSSIIRTGLKKSPGWSWV